MNSINAVYSNNAITMKSFIERMAPNTELYEKINDHRQRIGDIINGVTDSKLLVIIGPCSVHDVTAAREYAKRLKIIADKHKESLEIVMRVYCDKPRTRLGWKGLIRDPYLDGSCDLDLGISVSRELIYEINCLGLPVSTEFLDLVTAYYLSDLISWGAIGARTTESQMHRELASLIKCPIGFKNGTQGNVQIAIDAILAAREKHTTMYPDMEGRLSIVNSNGIMTVMSYYVVELNQTSIHQTLMTQ